MEMFVPAGPEHLENAMKLSLNWLQDYIRTEDISVKDFCDRMTNTGSKVEGYECRGENITKVVVGKITALKKHPNADKLTICTVDIGGDTPVQIVTGAHNVFEGAYVPAALDGANLPTGQTIKAGKLRGELSAGMLCSIAELGLDTHDMPEAIEDGILILDDSHKPGTDICGALMLKDTAVEFEITSNRPDCLSVIGLAREASASFNRPCHIPTPKIAILDDGDRVENYLSVRIDAPDLCPRYAARVVKNVRIKPSPLWMRRRLRAAGVRPINNIVDITNYVMLEYGQPMHAFDYACLEGSSIIVRRAANGESFRSLDDVDHRLSPDMLVIADKNKPVALAGIMGGANSEITGSTKTVVFESANFIGASVRVTAKKQGMRTESSARFEKGLDPENVLPALERACELVQLLDAGDVVSGITDLYPGKKAPRVLPLEVEKINRLLGTDLTADYMASVLTTLGFTVHDGTVTVPSWRGDVECMADFAEEVARIYGYNNIESGHIKADITQGKLTPKQAYELSLHELLCGMGLDEICTFSFISPKFYDRIRMPEGDGARRSITLLNPLGEDTSIMRTTALPSMLDVLARNNNRSNPRAALYEIATVYIPRGDDELPDERKSIVIGFYQNGDFYTLKGMCDNIFAKSRIGKCHYTAYAGNPAFHPGKCAVITSPDGREIGTLGEIHPLVAQNYGFEMPVYAAVLDFELLFALICPQPQYTPLAKYPASTRDFSFVCDESLEVGTIEKTMRNAGIKLLEDVKLFDIYRGVQIGEGRKSVSFRISLRAPDRTLTDEEADKVTAKILAVLERELNIKIRS